MARFADAVSARPPGRGGTTLGEARWPVACRRRPRSCPGLAYIRPLGSGGFADVFLYEQDMPRRNVAVKVMPSDVRDPELRRMFNAEADVLAHLSAHPVDRHGLPGGHLGRRPAVHRHGVLPRIARAALPHRAHPRRRGARDRRADGERARVRAPRGARPPRRQAQQHPHHDLRRAGARRLRHLVVAARARPPTRCSRCRSRGARPRWSPSRPPARSRARCGASARPSTRCSPATARSSAASAARTPRSSCAAASRGRATPTSRAPMCRHPCRTSSRRAMSRDPRRRYASAREFAEALRGGAGRARPLADAARDPRRGVDARHPARSTSATPACAGPRAVARRARGAAQDAAGRRRRGARPRRGHRVLVARAARAPRAAVGHRGRLGRGRRRRGRRRRPRCSRRECSDAAPHDRRARRRGRRRRARRSASASCGRDSTRRRRPRSTPSVWALQTGDGRRYARVNTTVGELDTVRSISNPEQGRADRRRRVPLQRQLQQAHADRRGAARRPRRGGAARLAVDACRHDGCRRPRATSSPTAPTPARSSSGCLVDGPADAARPVPVRRRGRPAVHRRRHRGRRARHPLQLLARRRLGAALRHRAHRDVRGRDPLDGRTESPTPAITAAGDTGRSSTPRTATCGCAGRMPRPRRPTGGAVVVGEPDPARRRRSTSPTRRRWCSVAVDGSAVDDRGAAAARHVARHARAARSSHDGEVFAAWLPQGDADGRAVELAERRQSPLDYGGETLGDQRRPTFVASDDAVILNETRSGWVWTVPDGALVAVEPELVAG